MLNGSCTRENTDKNSNNKNSNNKNGNSKNSNGDGGGGGGGGGTKQRKWVPQCILCHGGDIYSVVWKLELRFFGIMELLYSIITADKVLLKSFILWNFLDMF